MTFPWTNLITAVSTLTAALGATSLKGAFDDRAEGRRLRHQRDSGRADARAEAYVSFLKAAHADARLLGQAILHFTQADPEGVKLREAIAAASAVVDEFNAALGRVEIIGSAVAARAATKVAAAARTLGARFSRSYLSDDPLGRTAAETELSMLGQAIEGFASSCRRELSELSQAEPAMSQRSSLHGVR